MKMSKKKLLAIALTLTTFLAVFAVLRPGVSTEYIDVDDYCWIEGVLHDDTYALYPYAQEGIDIGFSKYGEMIGYNEDTGIGLGIQYPGYESAADEDEAPDGTYDQRIGTSVDPFCNEKIGVDWWMNGWFIDIRYTPLGGEAEREIWAFAMFSDGAKHGGDWITMPSVSETSSARPLWQKHPPYANPKSSAYAGIVDPIPDSGGRKTNGRCETDPIEVVYNGPRKFVAICKTSISDVGEAASLVDLTFTFIFNKAEKNAIILKDVKRIYEKSPLNIQFGDRGEWDLGIYPDTASYIHWYTDEPVQYWDIDPTFEGINTTEIEYSFEFFKEYMIKYKYPKKWWDEVPTSDIPTKVQDEWTNDWLTFSDLMHRYTNKDVPSWNETQETCYGREWHYDQTIKEHSYAVAQVISKAGDYVGALAVWPHPEFWAAHNLYYPPLRTTTEPRKNPESIGLMLAPISRMLEWHDWTVTDDPVITGLPEGYLDDREDIWVKMDDVVTAEGDTKEPIIPFTIYEHDFKLKTGVPSYRIVSVYMLTDRHDADDRDTKRGLNDEAWSDGYNRIDREIQYQLDEIFNPWDIYDAMHKGTKRWTQFFDKGVEFGEEWVSGKIKAWDGLKYSCIELDPTRTIETGKTIPSLPVYPGRDPGVHPTDWDNDHGLCWDAYCAFTERVLVDTGSGYELIPRGVKDEAVAGILTKPADYKPLSLNSYNFLDPTPSKTRHYYTINFTSGRICFYEYDTTTKTFKQWYLPKYSVVKVLWSSEHHETTAEQWDSLNVEYSDYWKLYPINNETFRFPLHHDIIPAYKPYTEVFLIEQPPVRLTTTGLVKYAFEGGPVGKANLTVYGVRNCSEIDVKYWDNATETWREEKFHKNVTGTGTQKFTYSYASNYTEKVWYHSEKALLVGDYVFSNATQTLYMQDPVPAGQWLLVNYTINGYNYTDFFLGDGSINSFVLHHGGTAASVTEYADVGSLNVTNTETREQILLYNDTATAGLGIHVPKIKTKIWWTDDPSVTDTYEGKGWKSAGTVWEEREWIRVTENKTRGNWIIQETNTCDYLVLDQPPNNTTVTELKIVFKVPSGRWEWGVVGKASATVDSLGSTMIVAAFKNKLIEFGLGGLDITDSVYGPRIPWMRSHADTDNRNHLFDDWCSYYKAVPDSDSWPISSSNIITTGGTAVNEVTEYFNDFAQALVGTTIGDGFYPVTCWDKALRGRGSVSDPSGFYDGGLVTDRFGYAVISTYKDKNGTIGFIVHGWTGQDTYYAAKWFDEKKFVLQHLNLHVTDLILRITYKTSAGVPICPPTVGVVEYLGTISEKYPHDC